MKTSIISNRNHLKSAFSPLQNQNERTEDEIMGIKKVEPPLGREE